MRGKVKRVNADKGYGFIKADNGTEYFFHRSEVLGQNFDSVHEGMDVQFEIQESPKGPRAAKITAA